MTVPGIDTLRGSSFACSGRVAKFSAAPALQPSQDLARMQEWPLLSHIELRALPASARSARLETKSTLHRWGLGGLADTAELLVSEIVTNAVRASTPIAHQQRETGQAARPQQLRLWLTSDRRSVLIQVWDSDHHHPVPGTWAGRRGRARTAAHRDPQHPVGLARPDEQAGKIVWAVCT